MRIGVNISPLSVPYKTGVSNYIEALLLPLMRLRPQDHFYLYSFQPISLPPSPNATLRPLLKLGNHHVTWEHTTLLLAARNDALDIFWATTASFPFFFPRSVKIILTLYDFTYLLFPKTISTNRGGYYRCFSRFFFRRADAKITISEGTRERLQQLYGHQVDLILTPPLKPHFKPIPEQQLTAWLKNRALESKGYLLAVGTREPRKNFLQLIRSYKGPLPLVIIGKQGWKSQQLEKELKQASHVKVCDYVPDEEIPFYLSGAYAFIMPSLYEGYGMPIAEALLCRTPVICTPVPEMIEAAQGHAHVISFDNFSKDLENILKHPLERPPPLTYPTGEEQARKLSALFDQLC